MKFPLQFILGDSRTQTILGEVHVSQDYQVNDAAGKPVPLGRWRGNDDEAPSYEDAAELVRRANAFDELLEFVEATLNSYPSGARAHYAAALLAKYDVPSAENKV